MPFNFLRRTHLLIDTDVQVRLSVRLAVCLLCYVLLFCLISLGEPLLVLLGVLTTDLSPDTAKQLVLQFSSTILAPLLFAVACMILHGVLILHRLAGPVFRIRKALDALQQRDLTDRINLREGDYLLSLAESYNRGTGQLHGDLEQARSGVRSALESDLDEETREQLLQVDEILDRYWFNSDEEAPEPAHAEDPVRGVSTPAAN